MKEKRKKSNQGKQYVKKRRRK